ncbi:MAG: heparinase II/III-family protein [Marinilabiliales bacterium]|nr:heparinase II/III-family protein [Marinilabiliales bacterium]
MKKILISLFVLLFCLTTVSQGQNLLSGKYSKEELSKILIPHDKWVPFPRIDDREGWAKADQQMMKAYLKTAEGYLKYEWPTIPATKSLLFERTGDRDEYQGISFKKREVLGTLLLAEIYENKGRFLDQIIDGVWSICEESFWGVPAHLPKTKELSGLIDVRKPFVELFSAETSTFLAWVDYYLGDKLDAVSPQIRQRIYDETNKRIFTPLMTQPHGFMAAGKDGRRPNNWNPWICSNWLNAVLLLEKDDNKRTEAVAKILHVLDQFLNPYPQDGGCDEGPGYWNAAGASLFDNLARLNLATHDAFSYVFQDEKIRNMGRFIYRTQISPLYFVNFADASPKPGMSANMIYRYGKAIGDEQMMRFGAWYRTPAEGTIGRSMYFRNFFALFIQKEFQSAPQGLPLPAETWLPDIQVMVARDKAGSTDGFFLAAKGGNNDESHNHNDIGNFVVYYNGLPVLIDVGSGTYTRKTFSDKRYDIWSNCSDYHNLPTINGKNQLPGAQYKAEKVSFRSAKGFAGLSLDIAPSYPAEAGIAAWTRDIRLNRGKNVQWDESIQLKEAKSITLHLMTACSAEVVKPGELVLHSDNGSGAQLSFVLHYNPRQMEATLEKMKLDQMEDKGVRRNWGDNICRISFKVLNPKTKDHFSMMLQLQK